MKRECYDSEAKEHKINIKQNSSGQHNTLSLCVKFFVLLMGIALFPFSSQSQSVKDVFESDEVVWFGLDFSNAKMISHEGFSNPQQIVNRFFRSWNNLILNEQNKYDIRQHFRKRRVIYDLSIANDRNERVDPDYLVLDLYETHEISEQTVQQIINEYRSEREGLGLVFIVESFNKFTETGTMYVTFFDIKTRKVLLTKKMTGETGGFGLRNYWARTYYNVILKCGDEYPKWRREYMD